VYICVSLSHSAEVRRMRGSFTEGMERYDRKRLARGLHPCQLTNGKSTNVTS